MTEEGDVSIEELARLLNELPKDSAEYQAAEEELRRRWDASVELLRGFEEALRAWWGTVVDELSELIAAVNAAWPNNES